MTDYPTTDARGRKLTALQSSLYVNRIPVEELVVGHLYLLRARSAHVGIYKHDPEGPEHAVHSYDLRRNKNGSTFIDNENDFDAPAFASAIPLKDLGPTPEFEDDAAKLAWLMEQGDVYQAEFKAFLDTALDAWLKSHGRERTKTHPEFE